MQDTSLHSLEEADLVTQKDRDGTAVLSPLPSRHILIHLSFQGLQILGDTDGQRSFQPFSP